MKWSLFIGSLVMPHAIQIGIYILHDNYRINACQIFSHGIMWCAVMCESRTHRLCTRYCLVFCCFLREKKANRWWNFTFDQKPSQSRYATYFVKTICTMIHRLALKMALMTVHLSFYGKYMGFLVKGRSSRQFIQLTNSRNTAKVR